MKQVDFTTKQTLGVLALAFLAMFIGILIGWNTSKEPVGAVSAGIVAVASVIFFIVSLMWPEEKHPPLPP